MLDITNNKEKYLILSLIIKSLTNTLKIIYCDYIARN